MIERPGAATLNGNPLTLVGPELRPGDPAPDFETYDTKLQAVRLADTGAKVRIFSVLPSLDTPVCDAQTKRFNDEVAKMPAVDVYTFSVDLPFAMSRWCNSMGVDNIKMLSDYRTGSFGEHYGTLIKDLRLESRAIFVIGADNKIRHVEYVKEVADHPDYDTALAAAKAAAAASA
jgi:thiol peroxidase